MIGENLGHYRITEKIGEGGMGEVYRAHDERLDRDVAIKVLPEEVAQDEARLDRFEREAKLLASLSHQNIATLYGLEEQEGQGFLVMELAEGGTLADRIASGPIPVEDVFPIALQIAEGLEAAHEQGIIHRDLKPANVMLSPEGRVKVLDFGLAKASQPDASDADITHSPTLTAQMTSAGVLLGTAAYMSPEHARGKPVDKRADLWAFGCVFFEMLTGSRAFPGDTVTDTLAAVIEREPDWSLLPAATPRNVVALLRKCLRKDPRRRLRDAGDAGLELEEPGIVLPTTGSLEASGGRLPDLHLLRPAAWIVAGLLGGMALVVLWLLWVAAPDAPEEGVRRLSVPLPPGVSLDLDPIAGPGLAISQDGRRLAYVAQSADGQRLFVHDLGSGDVRLVAGSEGLPESPFFSPDGQYVGFFAAGKLRKVSMMGGSPMPLCDAQSPRGGSWGEDGFIVFAPIWGSGLVRVSDEGGTPEPLTTLDRAAGETSHRWPQVLPGGAGVLFTIRTSGNYNEARIAVVSPAAGEHTVLLEGGSNPRYASSGHLVYGRAGSLQAVTFDLTHRTVGGSPVPVLERVASAPSTGAVHCDMSPGGSLVYRPGGAGVALTIPVWVDRSGTTTPITDEPGYYSDLDLSPDGTEIAVVALDRGGHDVWIIDVVSGSARRLTFTGRCQAPRWTPDGERVVFTSGPGRDLYWKRADGSGKVTLLVDSPHPLFASSWTPSGELLYGEANPSSGWDTWVAQIGGEIVARMLDGGPANVAEGAISPDGAWEACTYTESGSSALVVRPYPPSGSRWQVASEGARLPIWSPDGRELFYRVGRRLVAVSVQTAQGITTGPPNVVFQADDWAVASRFCVSPDGRRFVRLKVVEEDWGRSLHFVTGWLEELSRLLPNGE